MANYDRIRRQQLLLEAEGCLELVTACAEEFSLSAPARERLAQRALKLLAAIPGDNPDEELLLYLKGQAYRVMECYHEALDPLQKAVDFNPDNVHTWLALGWCYKRIGRLDMAIQSLEEALSIAPDQAIIYYNLACYWSLANNSKLALAYLTRAFDLDPSYRDLVAGESDFDPIRDHPGFHELTTVIV